MGLAGIGLAAAVVCAVLIGAGKKLLREPEQRVGLSLEFPGPTTDVRAACANLPRLLASAGARKVVMSPPEESTVDVAFLPPRPWSEARGLLADGDEAAPALVPEDLRTLLTAPCDLRFLQVLEAEKLPESGARDRKRTAAFLDGHPEPARRIESLRTSVNMADSGEPVIAWCPQGSAVDVLVPLLLEGRDRRVTGADLSGAWHSGAGDTRVELWVDDARRDELNEYLDHLVGRRVAFVVDGTIRCVTRVDKRTDARLVLAGDARDLTRAETDEIVNRVRQPLLPIQPKITRSWIARTHAHRSGRITLAAAAGAALVAAGAAWAFVRDFRRRPQARSDYDWSSSA
jgi:hypothetical protein